MKKIIQLREKKDLLSQLNQYIGQLLLTSDFTIFKISGVSIVEDSYENALIKKWSWRKFRFISQIEKRFVFGKVVCSYKTINNINTDYSYIKTYKSLADLNYCVNDFKDSFVRFQNIVGDLKTFNIITIS
ncbi:MAG: hypothetical protein ABIP51_18280 [Bacteroidia bacterium]